MRDQVLLIGGRPEQLHLPGREPRRAQALGDGLGSEGRALLAGCIHFDQLLVDLAREGAVGGQIGEGGRCD